MDEARISDLDAEQRRLRSLAATPLTALDALRELSDAATPGPWMPQSPSDGREFDWYIDTHYNEDGPEPVWADSYPVGAADVAFMVAAVNYVRSALAVKLSEVPSDAR